MQKTVYENYKYSLQDTAKVYIGAKYTFAELLEQDDVAFKFRLIVERYILSEKVIGIFCQNVMREIFLVNHMQQVRELF